MKQVCRIKGCKAKPIVQLYVKKQLKNDQIYEAYLPLCLKDAMCLVEDTILKCSKYEVEITDNKRWNYYPTITKTAHKTIEKAFYQYINEETQELIMEIKVFDYADN